MLHSIRRDNFTDSFLCFHRLGDIPGDVDIIFCPCRPRGLMSHWRNYVVEIPTKTVHVVDDLIDLDDEAALLREGSEELKIMKLLLAYVLMIHSASRRLIAQAWLSIMLACTTGLWRSLGTTRATRLVSISFISRQQRRTNGSCLWPTL